MSLHEITIPEYFDFQSRTAPGFLTRIDSTEAGITARTRLWDRPLRRFELVSKDHPMEDLYEIYRFFLCRKGAGFSFRLKDGLDFSTASDGISDPDDQDVTIGTGDGTQRMFQLSKKYTFGATTYERTIAKPVEGSVVVALGGSAKTEGTHYTVNHATGRVIFETAPFMSQAVRAGCFFDVPARFTKAADTGLVFSMDSSGNCSIQNLTLQEVRDEDERWNGHAGGGWYYDDVMTVNAANFDFDDAATQVQLPRLITVDGNASYSIQLPTDVGNWYSGLHWFFYNGDASTTLTVKNHLGSTIGSIAASKGAMVIKSNGVWVCLDTII